MRSKGERKEGERGAKPKCGGGRHDHAKVESGSETNKTLLP